MGGLLLKRKLYFRIAFWILAVKKGSIKNNRINQEVLKSLSEIIRDEVKDPRIDPFLSVTRVYVTPDLQYCKVHVSSLNGREALEKSIEGLTSAEKFIRYSLAHRVNLRKTPFLSFIPDSSMEYAMEMSIKIDKLIKSEEERNL